jgi:hypothetical protein
VSGSSFGGSIALMASKEAVFFGRRRLSQVILNIILVINTLMPVQQIVVHI